MTKSYYLFGEIIILLLSSFVAYVLYYMLYKIRFLKENFYEYISFFSIGWLIGANFLFLGWFRSVVLKASKSGKGNADFFLYENTNEVLEQERKITHDLSDS